MTTRWNRWKKITLGVLGTLGLTATALYGSIAAREDRTFEAPYPDIEASAEPEIVARGRYLARGPAHCVDCHASPDDAERARAGEEVPLRGGQSFHLPVGTFYSANITPDPETGIGRRTDAELARVLRYGVHHDGRAVLPFMPFADLSDEDLTAVISYIRSQPPVENRVPEHEVGILGRAIKAFVLEPTGPTGPTRAEVEAGPTAEYGSYLANTVANCAGCHTKRDMRTGDPLGEPFAGGMEVTSHSIEGLTFVTPDLRGEEGRVAGYDEEAFIARFHAGRRMPGSPMPWESYSRISDDDLRALHRYLRSLGREAPPEAAAVVAEIVP